MMERRRAARIEVRAGIAASVGGVTVRLLDLSAIGARLEHEERFTLAAPRLDITWDRQTVSIPLKVARSEIVGRRENHLVYQSGVQFTSVDSVAESVIALILRGESGAPEPPAAPSPRPPAPAPQRESFDDSWVRQVSLLKEESEDDLPYAQFRLTPTGWVKSYVGTPAQPSDGFTISRDDRDFHELQRTFETADPDTRRMMQIALESKLGTGG